MIKQKLTINLIVCLALAIVLISPTAAGWEQVDEILNRVNSPQFPDKDFNITDFGAVADGKTNCTEALRKAITAANEAGGGRVVVPAGEFISGTIHLKSNINLYLLAGAAIKFSTDSDMYLPVVYTRWEGVECMNYSPLVYAYGQQNIAVTGEGVLDGQGDDDNWQRFVQKQQSDRERLFEYGQKGVPVEQRTFGNSTKLRPNMVQFYKCKNILIEGVTIKNSPMWHIHPVLSQNITVRDVNVVGYGANNDGCNPESCRDVLIENCFFDTGDDCIAIKAGRNNDGRRVNEPSENIVIQNCHFKNGHGGVAIGSEMSGGVRNIFAENCIMDSPNLDRAIRIKTNSIRGGFVENVYVRNVAVKEVREAVLKINFYYEEADAGDYMPSVSNINMENITCGKSQYALYLKGYKRSPIKDIHLTNCTFEDIEKNSIIENVEDILLENVIINGELTNRADIKVLYYD